MKRLTEQYGIVEDPRYAQCNREAKVSIILFALAAAATVSLSYFLTIGRAVEDYGRVLGLPSYLFWSIIATFAAFLLAVILCLRFVFRPMSLEEEEDDRDRQAAGGGHHEVP